MKPVVPISRLAVVVRSVAAVGLAVHLLSSTPEALAEPLAYVALADGPLSPGVVAVVDTVAGRVVGAITVAPEPRWLVATADGRTIYVTHNVPDVRPPARVFLSVIDATRGEVRRELSSEDGSPGRIALSPDGGTVYVSNVPSGGVSIVDTRSHEVVDSFVLPTASAGGVAFSPNGRLVYVAGPRPSIVTVLETGSFTLAGTVAVHNGGAAIAVAHSGEFAYVAGRGTLALVNLVSFTRPLDIPIPGTGNDDSRFDLAFTPDGAEAFVTNSDGGLFIVDTRQNTVADQLTPVSRPAGVAIDADGSRAFVSGEFSGDLAVIDIGSRAVIDRIDLGLHPRGVALAAESTPSSSGGGCAAGGSASPWIWLTLLAILPAARATARARR